MGQSVILDIHGKPFYFNGNRQTENDSRLAALKLHYSEHPASGLTPDKAARILRLAERGDLIAQAELAEDMEEKDTHLHSELSKRRAAVAAVNWQIKPPANASAAEKRDAEMLAEILTDATWLEDCIFNATDAILKGYCCQEIEWENRLQGGLKLVKNVKWQDPAHFMTAADDRYRLRLRDNTPYGVELQPFGWIVHITQAKTGYLSRIGLVRTLIWPFLFKNYALRDFAEFLEIYGLPVRLGKYPEGATDGEKQTLLRAVMSIGHNAGGIIPRGMEIEFEKAADGGESTFMAMIEWAEKAMSKAILGGTLTSQADGASSTNALGNVHNEVRREVRNADLKRLEATLTRDLLYPLYALNGKSFNDTRRIPRFEFDISESEDLNQFAEGLNKLVDIGFKIPKQWAHDRLQVPLAGENEEILAKKSENPTAWLSAKATPPAKTGEGLQVNAVLPDDDKLFAEDLEPSPELLQAAADPLIKPIIDALQKGGYEFALQQLTTLYDEMNDEELEKILTRAIFISDLLGRADAER